MRELRYEGTEKVPARELVPGDYVVEGDGALVEVSAAEVLSCGVVVVDFATRGVKALVVDENRLVRRMARPAPN